MDAVASKAISKRKELSAELDAVKRQMDGLQSRLRELAGQVRLLDDILSEQLPEQDASDPVAWNDDSGDGPRPVDAIIEMVAKHPEGVSGKDLADSLSDKIATKSGNPRNIIHNTVHGLWKRGKIRRDEATGMYFPLAQSKFSLDDLDI